jgi:hypothetical protein
VVFIGSQVALCTCVCMNTDFSVGRLQVVMTLPKDQHSLVLVEHDTTVSLWNTITSTKVGEVAILQHTIHSLGQQLKCFVDYHWVRL